MAQQNMFKTVQGGTRLSVAMDPVSQSQKGLPALRTRNVRQDSKLDAMRSKMVKEVSTNINVNPDGSKLTPDMDYIDSISESTSLTVAQCRALLDALPDLELSMQIIVSSILSPNDMLQVELLYSSETEAFGEATPVLLNVIQDYFDNVYKIKKDLPDMVGRAIFTDGSYPVAIFPESLIDQVINSNLKITQESLQEVDHTIQRPLWILGNPDGAKASRQKIDGFELTSSFESRHFNADNFYDVVGNDKLNLTVSDNPALLSVPRLRRKLSHNRVVNKYVQNTASQENFSYYFAHDNKNKTDQVDNIDLLYPNREKARRPILDMSAKEADRQTIGHPVVFKPPAESVIPVHEPGNPEEHVGYFIVLDEAGNPIATTDYEEEFNNLKAMSSSSSTSSSSTSSNGSSMMSSSSSYSNFKEVANSLNPGMDEGSYNPEESAKLYASVIENELEQRLKNGDYKEKFTVAKATRVYRMMFTRACKQMNTKLLYVPAEFMSYLAYDYHMNGVGRSLLDKTRSIASLRMINMVADSLAAIKSSITERQLDILLDEHDPTPMKAIEQHIHEFSRATKAEFPIGQISLKDITESLQRAGVSVKVSGHPGVPDTRMDISTNNMSYNRPESDLDEKLSKKQTMGFAIPPDSVNSATEMEFEKNVVAYNVLAAKINAVRQETSSDFFTDMIQKYTRNSSILIDELTEVIEANKDKLNLGDDSALSSRQIAVMFINYIRVDLPVVDTSKIENEMEMFTRYSDALDKFLEAFISEEMMSSEIVGEEVGSAIRATIPIIKAYFLRQFMTKHNIAPELFSLILNGDAKVDTFDILSEHEEYVKSLMPAMKHFIIRMLQTGDKTDGVILAAKGILEQIKAARDNSGEASDSIEDESSGDDTSDEGESEDGDDDMFGGDDEFGDAEGDDDSGGDDDSEESSEEDSGEEDDSGEDESDDFDF